jgi:hypothetical protein
VTNTRRDFRNPNCDQVLLFAPGRVDIDRIDRTDIDTEHTVDALRLTRRVRFAVADGVARRFNPLEDVDGAIFQTRAIRQTDVEVDGDVGSVNPQRLRFVDGAPDLVTIVFVDDLAV